MAPKQTSLLGFFSKAPGPAPPKRAADAGASAQRAPDVATPPPTRKRARHSPVRNEPSSPSPVKATERASLTPPLSSDTPSPNTGGRRRAARRVNYAEPRADSDDSEAEPDEADEFVLDEESASESEADSAVESEEPATASEDEPDEAPPPRAPRAPPTSSPVPVARVHAHLTKAERRVEEEKRKKQENEQAYSFLLDVRDKDMHRPGDMDYDKRTLYIPPSAWKTFTPFEKQFWEIKQNHWDTVLFFQKGKFYELYEEDAMIGHRECDLKLTDRVKMKMVGVPEASFDMFATKLLALGYKVGRVDQCETAVAKGMRVGEKSRGGGSEIVRRELRHVVTSGTIVDGHVLSDDLNSYCVCLKEQVGARGLSRFGIVTLDAATAEFRYTTFDDDAVLTQLETLLRSLRVKEVLYEQGCLAPGTLRLVRNTVPTTCEITMLKPGTEFPDEAAARARLARLFDTTPSGLAPLLETGGPALAAMGALLWYLEQLHLDVDLCASGNVRERAAPQQGHGTLILDAKSLVHLHVLQNDEGTEAGTLHQLLNRCVTPFGRRLFRRWLAAPLCERAAIEARFDAVDDLRATPVCAEILQAFAKHLPDLERLQTRIAAGKCRPRDFLLVLRAFERFRDAKETLLEALHSCTSSVLRTLLDEWPDVAERAAALRRHFIAGDDGSFTPVQGESAAYDAAVDSVRAAERRLDDEKASCATQLGLAAHDVAWKHVGTNEIYQLELPARTKVPAPWILMSQTKAAKRYYTPRTKDLIRELKEARETRLAALKQFQSEVYAAFRADLPLYARAVRAVAQLDCLLSLAKSSEALGEPACRPTLVEQDTALFAFEQLRHPCMAPSALTGATEFIPNNVALGGDAEDIMVLTGGNMAGKSTTARTAATAVILAQLGCYVPAASARLAPVDRIASRMGANDQLFRHQSTFMVEMLEASKILREATPRSLVIMDELGRGTSTFDGQAIAYAVLHELATRTPCLCFFMTHYLTVAATLDGYPHLANRHMEVRVDDEQRHVVFTYRLVPGIAESSYGTQVAQIAGVPPEICTQAAKMSRAFWAEAQRAHAARAHCALPLESVADFAQLVAIGRGEVRADARGLSTLWGAAARVHP
ncbi:DNA mismatch repair protein msh6 [Malassezia caprae]|uniref:DNA mismatch repair protein n=1 Tax=Malassezia caprae TaxID=1381934 RepID=A0AAF0EAC0_9BASI|nr:DNA mismatch repair protein msh6 [Malassezia caprae]